MRLGLVDGEFMPFPTHDELEASELDLIISGTRDAVLMIEGFAREMPEDRMLEALARRPIGSCGELCDLQQELIDKVGVKKMDFVPPPNDGLFDRLRERFYDRLKTAKQTEGKQARAEAVSQVKAQALAELIPDPTAEGAPDAERVSERRGTTWKSTSSAI